jgi:alpha-mannosidase
VNQASPYRFDQYVYVTSGNKSPLLFPGPGGHGRKAANLTIYHASAGRLVSVKREPYGTVALLRSSGKNTPEIETKIILFTGEKKIEFVNHVYKKKVYSKEAVYFAFPFSMNDPKFRYETQNGYVNPSQDLLPGAGREWFSVQHWVAVREGGVTAEIVPVNSSLVTFGDIVRGKWPAKFGKRVGTIFSYVMNNYWNTNYVAAQGGKFTFRYVMTSGRDLTPAEMSRFGWNEMTPIEVDRVTPNDARYWRRSSMFKPEKSFLKMNSRDVVLSDWKRAQNNRGTIMRFIEMNGSTDTVRVSTPLVHIGSVWECDAMERDERKLTLTSSGFKFIIKPFQIETIRVEGD